MFDENMAFQREQYEQQREDIAPWMEAGRTGLRDLQTAMGTAAPEFSYTGTDVTDLTQDPLYDQRIAEQTDVLQRSGAARGGLLGGGTLRSLRDMTANEMPQAYGRNVQREETAYGRAVGDWQRQYGVREDRLNRLANLANVGQTSSQTLAGLSQQFAGNVGTMMGNQANTQSQLLGDLGQIQAAGAVAPFQNLMTLGTMGAGLMTGAGALGGMATLGGSSVLNMAGRSGVY
jgi:hypothetical protein